MNKMKIKEEIKGHGIDNSHSYEERNNKVN